MAGRYLLIEFDDEAAATLLRERIDNATRNGKRYRVVGLFARPSNFCRCGTWTTDRGRVATTKRGRRLGWTVCTVCKKPAPLMSFLRNLIRPEDIISPTKHDIVDTNQKPLTVGFYTYGLDATARSNFEGN